MSVDSHSKATARNHKDTHEKKVKNWKGIPHGTSNNREDLALE